MRTIDMIELALLIIQVTLFVLRHLWWVIRLHPVAWQTTGCMSPEKTRKKWWFFSQTIDKRSQLTIIKPSEHCALINNSPEVPPTCHRGHFYFTPLWATCVPKIFWKDSKTARIRAKKMEGWFFTSIDSSPYYQNTHMYRRNSTQ